MKTEKTETGEIEKDVSLFATRATASTRSAEARVTFRSQEFTPLFHADWTGVVFIHFAVEPEALQSLVPFPLDLHEGLAYVSLVAFTMQRMRLGPLPGWASSWLLRPLAPCRYLNVRTYVREQGRDGIFFLAEWLSNHTALPLGPACFGLPYRAGSLAFPHRHGPEGIRGRVDTALGGTLMFTGSVNEETAPAPAAAGSLDEFLLERYTAFTERHGLRRLFRVWHPPWPQQRLDLQLNRATLLPETGPWYHHARLIGAHYSSGVKDVWMGRPHRLPFSYHLHR